MKKPRLGEKIEYWYDNQVAKGSGRRVFLLALATALVVAFASFTVSVFGLGGEKSGSNVVWDYVATVINAWMPYGEDAENVPSLIITAFVAVAGLFVTSMLIGILSSGIEEKLTGLKKGNARVLEEGHTVLIGFECGEYQTVQEIVDFAGERNFRLLIADETERDEMEGSIRANVDIPKNVKLITRNIDTTDPVALECCSLPYAKTVVIDHRDDTQIMKAVLAVSAALKNYPESPVKVTAAAPAEGFIIPEGVRDRRISYIKTKNVIARIIARSCTNPGLSSVYTDLFSFKGSEFYVEEAGKASGKSFGELLLTMDGAVPAGFAENGDIKLFPEAGEILKASDRLVYFGEDEGKYEFCGTPGPAVFNTSGKSVPGRGSTVVIFGINDVFDDLLAELPGDARHLRFIPKNSTEEEEAERIAAERGISMDIRRIDASDKDALEDAVSGADHVILLNDHSGSEDSDLINMLALLNLRAIRSRRGDGFTITAEFMKDSNRRLVLGDDSTDYIVAANIASMILVQTALNPEIVPVLKELTTSSGYELTLKSAADLEAEGTHSVCELRRLSAERGCIMLGYVKISGKNAQTVITNSPEDMAELLAEDSLIVIRLSRPETWHVR